MKHFNGSAANLVASAKGSAVELVALLTAHFPGFRDHAIYKGRQVSRCRMRAPMHAPAVCHCRGPTIPSSGLASFTLLGSASEPWQLEKGGGINRVVHSSKQWTVASHGIPSSDDVSTPARRG